LIFSPRFANDFNAKSWDRPFPLDRTSFLLCELQLGEPMHKRLIQASLSRRALLCGLLKQANCRRSARVHV
jgi:hypothetical protein